MENKNGQGIFYGVIGVATLIVAIIGATFAYFSASATNGAAVINGTTGQGGQLALAVDKVAPSGTAGKFIPLDVDPVSPATSQLASGLAGYTGKGSCIDKNDNTVCGVYSITITNNGDTGVTVNGKLTLTSEATNMKWKLLTNATTDNNDGTFRGTGTAYDVVASESLAASGQTGNSHTYYVMVWLEETGSSQDDADANKGFSGSVTFTAAGGTGLTATFS